MLKHQRNMMLTMIGLTLTADCNKPIFPKNFTINFIEAMIKNIESIINTIKNIMSLNN